jgi:RNA polymerase sigma factor (sigma-70 family)
VVNKIVCWEIGRIAVPTGKQKLLDLIHFFFIFKKTSRLAKVGHDLSHDWQIIGQIRQNGLDKRKGEESLFSRYSYFIREGVRKHRMTEDQAFDAYSDSILAVIDNINNGIFKGESSLKSYLYKIFCNKCVDLFRKSTTNKNIIGRAHSIDEELFRLSDMSRSILQTLIEKADWTILKERITRLGEDCKKMLLLWADSYSDKEIAEMMEYKTANVAKTSRLRCLAKLRQLYAT